MSAIKPIISFGLRLLVSIAVFYLIFRSIDVEGVTGTILSANVVLLLLAMVSQFLSTLVASYRWSLVMRQLNFGENFLFYLKSFFKGSFFNQGLPTSIGGDALRVLDVARLGHRKRDAFYGVAVDRGLGLAGLLVFNLFAHLLRPDLLPEKVFIAINALVLLGIVGFILIYYIQRVQLFEDLKVTRIFYRISQRLNTVLHDFGSVVKQFGLSFIVHLFAVLAISLLGGAVGMEFDLLTYMVIVPPVILLTIVPVSLAGWGVREGGMIGLFTLIGADNTMVLSMSILYGVCLIVTSLPGLFVYLSSKHHL